MYLCVCFWLHFWLPKFWVRFDYTYLLQGMHTAFFYAQWTGIISKTRCNGSTTLSDPNILGVIRLYLFFARNVIVTLQYSLQNRDRLTSWLC